MAAPPPWCADDSAGAPGPEACVLFTRALRRRNFAGFSFWVACTPEACEAVVARAREVARGLGLDRALVLAGCSAADLGFFRERQWLPERPVSFPGKRAQKTLFLGADAAEHAWAGEVEHWTQVRVEAGLPPVLREDPDADPGPFCRSEPFGFLTSNPAFAGPGLQVECAVHLPALTAARRIPQVGQALQALGLELQALTLRHPGSAEAGFFRVASKGGMGFSSQDLYRYFKDQTTKLLEWEGQALEQWKSKEQKGLEDRVYRSLSMLQEARVLAYAEFLLFASFARMGTYLGLFAPALRNRLEELRIRVQPFHLEALLPAGAAPTEADILRANVVRSRLKDEGFIP